ncbi:MAG: DUF4976 domain-containing protein, partial [Planctomycetes bacterium]|nr:DUF4976 domain-containing protein [Planctomycetota bacterium]
MLCNVLWIFIDGVRRYHSSAEAIAAGDDRSRLDIMDEFSKESVEFLNTLTSAPSTFQSLSAMVSGMHSYYINRNFDDFIFDKENFPSITSVLSKIGFHRHCFLMHKDTREVLANVFPMIDRKYWPKGFSHQKWWSNDDINKAVGNVLTIGVEKPCFFLVDYNCRKDPQTSDKVKWAIERFRRAGFTKDNTITILCSDHGYPDSSKETGNPEFYKTHNLTHDTVLTDDNAMIPLLIQYPGCSHGEKIETTIGSIDIYPTVLELLGLDVPSEIHGKSLIPLVDGNVEYKKMMESRYHRCDSRLSFQSGRGTAIRNGSYKYIFYHDATRGKNEEFFDIENDPLEEKDLVNSQNKNIKKQLELFRNEYRDSENKAMDFQLNYLFRKFSAKHDKDVKNAKEILITDSCSPSFIEMIVRMIKKINTNTNIRVLFVEHNPETIKENVTAIYPRINSWAKIDAKTIASICKDIKFDILFAPYNTSEGRDNAHFAAIVKKIKANKKIYLDYNMEGFTKTVSYYWKRFKIKWLYIKYEPLFWVICIGRFLINKLAGLFNKRTNWAAVLNNKTSIEANLIIKEKD